MYMLQNLIIVIHVSAIFLEENTRREYNTNILHTIIKTKLIILKIVCIPAYNEESVIPDIVKKSLPHVDKVIVCDDGSTDNTAKVAKEAGAIVTFT